jgi:hypothetical protein
VAAKLQPGDRLVADANTGWVQHEAVRVAKAVRDVEVYIEQPCLTYEECLAVRRQCPHPFVLDENIDDLGILLRAKADLAMDVVNLKISKRIMVGIDLHNRVRAIVEIAHLRHGATREGARAKETAAICKGGDINPVGLGAVKGCDDIAVACAYTRVGDSMLDEGVSPKTRTTVEDIYTGATNNTVIASAAIERVIADITVERIPFAQTVDDIISGATADRVRPVAALERVITQTTIYYPPARAAIDIIIAVTAVDRVILAEPID